MIDDALERGGNEILLAIDVNDGEPPILEMLPRATAGVLLNTLLHKTMTIGASLANAEDQGLDNPAFWRDLAETLYDRRPLPPNLLEYIEKGYRLTNTT